jgi:dnd system-associated protein 4
MLITTKRFKRSSNKELVYKLLKDKTNVFFTYAEIFVFLVALGLKYRKKKPLEDSKLEPIAYTLFNDNATRFMDLVVLFETNDINSLDLSTEENVKKYMQIIEEYANGGAEILLTKLEVHPEAAFELFLTFIDQEIKDQIPLLIDEDL